MALLLPSLRALAFGVMAALMFGGLELAFPARPRPSLRPRLLGGPGAGTDVLHALVDPLLVHPFALGLYALLGGALAALVPAGLAASLDAAPLLGRVAVALVVTDIGAYALHRLAHASPSLWAIHAVHHSSRELDWLASFRQHPIDTLLHVAVAAVPFLALRIPVAAVLPLLLVMRLHTVWVHANVHLMPRWLAPWIAGPGFHRRHHELDRDGKNFATLFPWLDHLFGTHASPDTGPPRPHGTRHPVPEGYMSQLISPLPSIPRFLLRCTTIGAAVGAVLAVATVSWLAWNAPPPRPRFNSEVIHSLPTASTP